MTQNPKLAAITIEAACNLVRFITEKETDILKAQVQVGILHPPGPRC
jgi:hypothetical protein